MQWLAAYSTHPASLPGKEGTPFVPTAPRRDGEDPSHPNDYLSTKAVEEQENNERRTTKDPLPLPPNTAAKKEIEEAQRRRNICSFRARGQDYPFHETGCPSSHEQGDVAYGFYRNTVQRDAEQATNQTSYDMTFAYDLAGKGPSTSTDDTDDTAK